jgi:alkanesulfonate monooxygenase SsuD/methylene tetrahydromethanopterin reductase-like flavin-dependent oxidoreductase (luciferase family)
MYRGESRRGAGKSWEELNEVGIAIWGNPDTVIKKISYLHERCQVGHLMMMMQAGFMPTEHTRKSLKLFAEEVYPAIRDLGEPLDAPQEAAPSR